MTAIRGISRTSLWTAWKEVRAQIKQGSVRDVIDHLEYDIDPDVWINQLLRRISLGEYGPRAPKRFMIAKSNGFDRQITELAIPDLVLYRAIADYLYRLARRRERNHVYFERQVLACVRNQAFCDARATMMDYRSTSRGRFLTWLLYDQYRKYLLLKRVYPYIVVTDISNFFNSVLYSRVADSLLGLRRPRDW